MEAERFSIFGQELSPVKQLEKIKPNVLTSFGFKSLKSEDLVAFRRLIESGELDKVKEAVHSNPKFLVSSGDTPSIIQVKFWKMFYFAFFLIHVNFYCIYGCSCSYELDLIKSFLINLKIIRKIKYINTLDFNRHIFVTILM